MFRQTFSFFLIFCFGFAIALTSTFSVRGSAQESVGAQLSSEQQSVAQAYLSSIQSQGASPAIQVSQVVVVDQYALLEWSEQDGGGDCLLQKQDGQWRIIRGSGGSFSVVLLNEYLHVPLETAQALVQQLHPESLSAPSLDNP